LQRHEAINFPTRIALEADARLANFAKETAACVAAESTDFGDRKGDEAYVGATPPRPSIC
jgi:hypothetical protein